MEILPLTQNHSREWSIPTDRWTLTNAMPPFDFVGWDKKSLWSHPNYWKGWYLKSMVIP